MFRTWQEQGKQQHRILGRTVRKVVRDKTGRAGYSYDRDEYSLALTNNAFMDVTMANWYWENDRQLRRARAIVDENLNCEDILMNCKYPLSQSSRHCIDYGILSSRTQLSWLGGQDSRRSSPTKKVISDRSRHPAAYRRDLGTAIGGHGAYRHSKACLERF